MQLTGGHRSQAAIFLCQTQQFSSPDAVSKKGLHIIRQLILLSSNLNRLQMLNQSICKGSLECPPVHILVLANNFLKKKERSIYLVK